MDNYWTIHGKKYDLREFIERHPGGKDTILMTQGKDCTELFESYHTFTKRHTLLLDKYYIKDVPDYKSDFDWDNTPFYDECKAVVKKYFSPTGKESNGEIIRNSKIPWKYAFGYFIGFLLMLYSFYRFCIGDFYAIFYFPVLYWIIGSECMHTGSHYGFCTYPIVNKSISYIGNFHCQYYIWSFFHIIGHHQHTNILDKDPDLEHFLHEDYSIPGYKVHKKQYINYSSLWKFIFHYTEPFLTSFGISLLEVSSFLEKKKIYTVNINEEFIDIIRNDRLIVKLLHILFIGCYPHGILKGFFALFWAWNIHGKLFNFFSQVSHLNEGSMVEVEKYKKKKDKKKVEWAIHQMLSTMDYSQDNIFMRIFTCNLNYQIVHHMFPSVYPAHYPAIRKLLIPIAKKYDIDYEKRSSQTFSEALENYFNWIYSLNEDPKEKVLCMRKSTLYGIIGTSVMITTTFVLPMYYLF
tara:strand:+ start:3851 stop:5242 length:1392 start_codon:yes stop_codon:yes gene_type:complete